MARLEIGSAPGHVFQRIAEIERRRGMTQAVEGVNRGRRLEEAAGGLNGGPAPETRPVARALASTGRPVR